MTYLFCTSLGLWIVMLSARNAWGYSPGPVLLGQPSHPTPISLIRANVVARQTLVVLTLITDTHQQQPSGTLQKQGLLLHARSHTARSQGEREREQERGPGVLPFLGLTEGRGRGGP